MRPKDKGTQAESWGVEYLQVSGFPYAERMTLSGSKDRGDIKLCPGVVAEVKNCKTLNLPAWFAELGAEVENANAKHGFLLIKPKGLGRTRVGQWWAGMLAEPFSQLHSEAGWPEVSDNPAHLPGHRYKDDLPHRIAALSKSQEFGYVVVRPTGVDDLRCWYVMTQLSQVVRLLRMAGYGTEVLV